MRILERYILIELGKVFLITLLGLTSMMMVAGVMKEALSRGLPMAGMARLLPFVLPEALQVAVPVALLLGCTTVFGRLSNANEIVAIKATGISPMAVIAPALVLGFLLSLLTAWLNDLATSWGRVGIERVIAEAIEDIIYSTLRTQLAYSSPNGFAINVKRVEGRRLLRVKMSVRNSNRAGVLFEAEEARLSYNAADNALRIELRKGKADWEGRFVYDFTGTEVHEVPLFDPTKQKADAVLPSWLPLSEIPGQTRRNEELIEQLEQMQAARAAYMMVGANFEELTNGPWVWWLETLRDKRKHLARLVTEPHRRWALGFACFFWIWAGIPLAIRLRNADLLTSFFLCFLPILVLYYPLIVFCVNGSKNGTLSPWSLWGGNLLLLAWGAVLLRKVIRY